MFSPCPIMFIKTFVCSMQYSKRAWQNLKFMLSSTMGFDTCTTKSWKYFFKPFNKGFWALIFYHTIPTFNDPDKESFWNIVEKGENAGNQHFLLFQQCFLPLSKHISIFGLHLFCHLQRIVFQSLLMTKEIESLLSIISNQSLSMDKGIHKNLWSNSKE